MTDRILADLVLLLHAAFVAFVVLGLVLTLIGGVRRWRWVRNVWFRLAHLAAIGFVVAETWGGVICPLTTLENTLRVRGGQQTYSGGFIADWVRRLLFYEFEPWVFTVAYTAFGALVVAAWVWVRPRRAPRLRSAVPNPPSGERPGEGPRPDDAHARAHGSKTTLPLLIALLLLLTGCTRSRQVQLQVAGVTDSTAAVDTRALRAALVDVSSRHGLEDGADDFPFQREGILVRVSNAHETRESKSLFSLFAESWRTDDRFVVKLTARWPIGSASASAYAARYDAMSHELETAARARFGERLVVVTSTSSDDWRPEPRFTQPP